MSKKHLSQSQLHRAYAKLDKSMAKLPTVKVGKDGRVKNWNKLSKLSQEDCLESGIYDDVDFSHSKLKYPALHKYNQKHLNQPPYWI